jgi:cytochrome b pre-mRNA-processing protein 3
MHLQRSLIAPASNVTLLPSPTQQHHAHPRPYSVRVVDTDEGMGVIKKFMRKVGLSPDSSKAAMKLASFYLYETVADNINYMEFFDHFELPDTFNSWFVVTELHVWMLLVRAMAEGSENGQDGRFLRNAIVEAMWSDVNTRSKKLGADNPSGMRSQVQILSQQFQAALITYDEGLASDDKTLAGALWRRFFGGKCNDYEKMEQLVRYIRKQVS